MRITPRYELRLSCSRSVGVSAVAVLWALGQVTTQAQQFYPDDRDRPLPATHARLLAQEGVAMVIGSLADFPRGTLLDD